MGDPIFRLAKSDLKHIRRSGGRMTTYDEAGRYLRVWWDDESQGFGFKSGVGIPMPIAPDPVPPMDAETKLKYALSIAKQLSAEEFLRQRYSEHSVGRQQMKAFLRDWIEAGWPHFSGEVVSAMGVRVYDAIMAEVELANTADVWLKAPEAATIESDDAHEYDVEQARVALWNNALGMDPPAMDNMQASSPIASTGELNAAVEKLERARSPEGGPLYADAVKPSEFGLAPQVGKMLLDGLKRIRDELRAQSLGLDCLWIRGDIARLIAEAEKPGFLVPDEMAETLDDGVGMWGWKESARIMPTDSRKIWIWVCRPGATESRLMRASDFHGIEPKMRVEYWRHAETPTPPKR